MVAGIDLVMHVGFRLAGLSDTIEFVIELYGGGRDHA
jgi:hypothetical protein